MLNYVRSDTVMNRHQQNVDMGLEGHGYRTQSGVNANNLGSLLADLDERAAARE